MPGTRSSGLLALGGIVLAAVLAMVGHLEVSDDLDPWSLTVSDFAVSDRGGVIDTAMAVLAAASLVLLPSLRRAGAGRVPLALLTAWSTGLLAAAVVPTNEPGTPMDTAAYVHRYASVLSFLALPVAGWLLARHPVAGAAAWLRGLTVASLVLAGAMIWSAYPGDRALLGLIERLLILTETAVITTLALHATLSLRTSAVDHAVATPHGPGIPVGSGAATP
ncbi:DUF998 domain-containing protein [Micromonospora aurantiaca]|uniref:DUF998 domain-containing protein n=1 Tax=Micromonospora aurantiaca (nom. illeg.) TaxID=47850 RepID=A0A6N3K0D9_9ACTN|nr:DUF998 domain-containing protein [Micromonospora aurantiaca]AXH90596.1 DUF998 domain-containing protein [Micromonospora aurantiaca]